MFCAHVHARFGNGIVFEGDDRVSVQVQEACLRVLPGVKPVLPESLELVFGRDGRSRVRVREAFFGMEQADGFVIRDGFILRGENHLSRSVDHAPQGIR